LWAQLDRLPHRRILLCIGPASLVSGNSFVGILMGKIHCSEENHDSDTRFLIVFKAAMRQVDDECDWRHGYQG